MEKKKEYRSCTDLYSASQEPFKKKIERKTEEGKKNAEENEFQKKINEEEKRKNG